MLPFIVHAHALLVILTLFFFLYLVSLPAFCSNVEKPKIRCRDKERAALLAIKESLYDGQNYLSTWNITNRDCCRWTGITCDKSTGNVFKLDLRPPITPDGIYPIGGDISPSLVQLQHLTYLDLSYMSFHIIPEFLGALSQLKYLNLSQGSFGEAIPYQLGDLSKLEVLDISFNINNLYVDNLEWLSRLSALKFLVLGSIDFTRAIDWLRRLKMLPSLTSLKLISCQFPDHFDAASLASGMAANSLTSVYVARSSLNPLAFPWLLTISLNVVNLTITENQLTGEIPDSFENLDSLALLDLSVNQLEGGIPKSFGKLCNIKTLDISRNNLSVPFPAFLGNLGGCSKHSLEVLRLNNNKLNGSLHDVSSFSSLKELYLDGNQLEGTLPENTFPGLPKLEVLNLKGNKINGLLPKSIGNISTLRILDVSSNYLSGPISETHFMKLSGLKELDLSFNSLVLNLSNDWIPPFRLSSLRLGSCKVGSHFPDWLHMQNNLSRLDISNSEISSEIPSWFWNLSPNLLYLNLSFNHISGKIPDLPLKFRGFPVIDLSNNLFYGPLPHFFSNSSVLQLSNNMLNGSIPFLCTKTKKPLSFLDLSDNMLSGELPDCFIHWNNLVIFNLANNKFSGTLPTSLGSLTRLKSLRLSNNSFKGLLPSSLRNCSQLKLLDLGINKISHSVPVWIGKSLASLIVLRLRSNEFNGSIPSSICHLSSLRIFDLSFNSLSGKIPHCINNFTGMTKKGSSSDFTISYGYIYEYTYWDGQGFGGYVDYYFDSASVVWKGIEHEYQKTLGLLRLIDISSNKLTGDIPEELTGLSELITLNLSRNSLVGNIPKNIGRLKVLESLDLSRNKLSGEIPVSLSQISSLAYLDLSYNNLSGKIPSSTQLQSFNPSAYAGNAELCGPPLTKSCLGDETEREMPNTSDNKIRRDGVLPEKTCFYVGIAVGFFVGFWGFCGALVISSSWRFIYFKFLNEIKDRILVAIALKRARLRCSPSN